MRQFSINSPQIEEVPLDPPENNPSITSQNEDNFEVINTEQALACQQQQIFDESEQDKEIQAQIKAIMTQLNNEPSSDDPFASNCHNFFFLVLSILVCALYVTELGPYFTPQFTPQQQVKTLMSTIFDQSLVFDMKERTRLDIESAEDIYEYLRLALIPALFNEAFKSAMITPYLRPYLVINVMTNETEHFVNCGPNYIVGLMFTRQAISYQKNMDLESKKVISNVIQGEAKSEEVLILGQSTY
ncbi:hypothetical protein FGO68_gene13026 [Halteria grandinella]|uniref:Uncharacterized protein n=1 Tax=Halteria grandinella TaxID=5974 RepID=A0A8J8NDW8_HALGN|nr:hypothetical protein FGO68_gene13026 [Halteria grandinella]